MRSLAHPRRACRIALVVLAAAVAYGCRTERRPGPTPPADAGPPQATSARTGATEPMPAAGAPARKAAAEKPPPAPAADRLSEDEQKTLLAMAREQLVRIVTDGTQVDVKNYKWTITPRLQADGAVFVTLTSGGRLRGCIGDIVAHQPLYLSVLTNAVNAARRDPRFAYDRIAEAELPQVHIEISCLTPQKPVAGYGEIVVGRHGVLMEKDGARAVFLPQVATEQHWDRDTMLRELSLKAGLDANAYESPNAKFRVFEAQVFGEARTKEK